MRGFSYKLAKSRFGIRVLALSAIKGKPVKFRYGPAAVIGDERRTKPLSA